MDTITQSHVGRRETPTATLVLSVDAPRSEWLEQRRHGITATDLPAILGLSQYRTAIDVWNEKIMPLADDDPNLAEAAIWGMRLEEPVAQEWAARHDVKVRRVGLVQNEQVPWAMASLDRLVTGCPDGRCALEVKTRSLFVGEQWDKGLPEDVRTQVMWQLAVTGLDHIHVAALIGGQRMVEHTVHRNYNEIQRLNAAARLVWDAVQAGEMPDLPPHMWSAEYVEQRHTTRSGTKDIDANTATAFGEYAITVGMIKDLEDKKSALRTLLVGALGEAETATWNGAPLYTYKAQTRRTLDSKKLAAKYPDVASDDTIYTTSITRALRVIEPKENK